MIPSLVKKSFRDITRKKARSFFLVASIALGVVGLSLTAVVPLGDRAVYDKIEEENMHNLKIRFEAVPLNASVLQGLADIDNVVDVQEIGLLLSEAGAYDAVIGFRKVRKDPPHRILYARTWNMLIRLFLGLSIKDLNCAFKLIRKNVLADAPLISSGAMISAELLLRAKCAGARIREVGVSHRPRMFGRQTGGNPKVILRALIELFRLYKKHRFTSGRK